uniref:Uncharacterized protein n=1 Tax=Setaria digitata TaxID=48799 RepID=A0A915Q3G1_9BILA
MTIELAKNTVFVWQMVEELRRRGQCVRSLLLLCEVLVEFVRDARIHAGVCRRDGTVTLRIDLRPFNSDIMSQRGPLTIDGWYPRDHMPDDYPKNEEERRAAAIKYGMRPEDYKPYDKDDHFNYAGNYPDYGCVTYDHKDPYENWSDPHYRRNWGEGMLKQYPYDIKRAYPFTDPRIYPITNYTFEPMD